MTSYCELAISGTVNIDVLDITIQVKVAILKYIESLGRQMDPADFVNSSETRLAVSRIITWTTEPKSSDVRKVSFHIPMLCLGLCIGHHISRFKNKH